MKQSILQTEYLDLKLVPLLTSFWIFELLRIKSMRIRP